MRYINVLMLETLIRSLYELDKQQRTISFNSRLGLCTSCPGNAATRTVNKWRDRKIVLGLCRFS
jgi:excinuclease UvrABC ATPase subunit